MPAYLICFGIVFFCARHVSASYCKPADVLLVLNLCETSLDPL